jgi:amino acid transporter
MGNARSRGGAAERREANLTAELKGQIGLWDAVSIIVGIVIGTTIFKAPAMVFQSVSGPYQAMAAWALGGGLSLAGALCYAELATTYPEAGGDYQYLRRAFGPWMGFLFGWAQLSVILTGSIGAMAYAFADYFQEAFPIGSVTPVQLAVTAVILLSVANVLGVSLAKSTQNVLSGLKVLGLIAIVVIGFSVGENPAATRPPGTTAPPMGFGLAMVFVLYAYGGWNDAAFVAAEMRNPRRNIPWALVLGIAAITLVYLLVNGAYLWVLGFEQARESWTPATDVVEHAIGPGGARAISLLIVVCALSAIHGLILTGSRIFTALGEDHPLFRPLTPWSARWGTPARSIIAQGVVTVALMLLVGTQLGQSAIDGSLVACGLAALPWETYFGGFETLVAGTAPVFWSFFLLTGIAQVVLRFRDRYRKRPFTTPWFPIPTVIFCSTSVYMLYASVNYAKSLCLIGVVPLVVGLALYTTGQLRRLGDVGWTAIASYTRSRHSQG